MSNYFSFCLICGSGSLKKLKKYEFAFLVKCRHCGFVFSQKKPLEKDLISHYKAYSPIINVSDITIKRYNELLDTFEIYRVNNNILDVGCGDGFFLMEAKKRKWNVFGTEFRDDAIKKCTENGINMHRGNLTFCHFKKESFDVITSFEVIEHQNNPLDEIAIYYQLLKPRGIIYVTTPNFNSFSRLVLMNRWNVIEYPEHLSYYTKKTIYTAFAKCGFELIDYKITGISIARLLKGIYKKINRKNSQINEDIFRKKIEINYALFTLKKTINFLLTLSSRGDTLKILFRKINK